jgi:hypothetical protein
MLDHTDQDKALGKALRDAEYASLTRRAVTDNSRAIIDDVHRQIVDYEKQHGIRKRRRVGKALAFIRALEGFVGDLLEAAAHKERAAGWVHRSVAPGSFTDEVVSYRDFKAIRAAAVALEFVEETPGVVHWAEGFGQQFALRRYTTRFRAAARLEELATAHGVSLLDISKHFITELPKHPLVLRGHSRRAPENGYKIPGKVMTIAYTEELRAMEQTLIDLNNYIDQFDVRGGTHRGFIRVFNCGDDPAFQWNLGGRLYSPGKDSYQQMKSGERLQMTIDRKPVCELDIKASYLTIFHAQAGQPLDFAKNPDPYDLPELSATPGDVVKAFITATFGHGQFPVRWSPKAARDYREKTGESLSKQHPIKRVRDAVAKAYPLLAGLRQDDAEPPIWARLMYLERKAVFQTMLALKDLTKPHEAVEMNASPRPSKGDSEAIRPKPWLQGQGTQGADGGREPPTMSGRGCGNPIGTASSPNGCRRLIRYLRALNTYLLRHSGGSRRGSGLYWHL